ncbi:MAG: rhodanese-like domain-containing protein [Nitrospirae bacterium]|nr:rhodanese-like domain-containing protein [Nitrospirota bacterium]
MPYVREWKIPIEAVTKEELFERIIKGDDFILVDTIGKYGGNRYRIKEAITIDYPSVIDRRNELLGHKEIIIYCKHKDCTASKKVAAALISLNVKDVKIYEGGIDEWVASGLPVEDE